MKKREVLLIIAGLVLAGIFLVFDLSMELGVAAGVPYIAIVLLGLYSRNNSFIITAAVLGSAFTLLGYYFSPLGGEPWKILSNRILALGAIWVTAILCYQQKANLKKLVESKKGIDGLVNSIVDGIISMAEDGKIISVNPAAKKLFMYSAEEMVGNNIKMLMPDPYRREHDGYIGNYLDTGKAKIIGTEREVVGLRKDRSTFPLELGVSEVWTEDQRIFTGILRDITERKKVEELTTRLGRIMDNSFNEIYMFDAETLRFTQVNYGARKNLGYNMEELSQLTPLDLKPEHTLESFERLIGPLKKNKEPVILFETVHKRKDGSLYPVEVRLQLVHEETPPIFAAFIQDITERLQAEKEIEKYQHHLEELIKERTKELESIHKNLVHSEKLAAIGKLSASIAHEFNNPIYGIKNVLEEVEDGVEMTQEYRNLIEIGIKECRRISDLIKKLQEFYRPSAQVFASVDVHKAIDDVVLLSKKKLEEEHIKLKLNYAPQKLTIKAVPDQIRQVVLNILQNAEDSIPETGGRITISTERVNSTAKIHIEDTGCGIKPETMENIFEPFFTTKPTVKGTGLGLSICHGIVKAHGGDIEIDSEPGRGTKFSIIFPVKGS